MGRIVLMMSVSVDGYFSGPNGELDWHRVDDEVHAHFNEVLGAMAAFLDGRRTYELMAAFWPTADRDPSSTPPMVDFARIWRDMPKVVYSRTLDHHPVLIGRGKPLFGPTDERRDLSLAEARTFGNGVVLLRHQRARR